MRASTRVDAAKLGGQGGVREFGDRAGEFDAGRAAADDDEGQKRRALPSSGWSSASSKARRMRPRMVVASSSVLRPGANGSQESWPK